MVMGDCSCVSTATPSVSANCLRQLLSSSLIGALKTQREANLSAKQLAKSESEKTRRVGTRLASSALDATNSPSIAAWVAIIAYAAMHARRSSIAVVLDCCMAAGATAAVALCLTPHVVTASRQTGLFCYQRLKTQSRRDEQSRLQCLTGSMLMLVHSSARWHGKEQRTQTLRKCQHHCLCLGKAHRVTKQPCLTQLSTSSTDGGTTAG